MIACFSTYHHHHHHQDLAPTLIFTTALAPAEARRAWETAGVEVCDVAAAAGGGVALPEVLAELGARGVVQLMVEGGGVLHGSFLAQHAQHVQRGVVCSQLQSALARGSSPCGHPPLWRPTRSLRAVRWAREARPRRSDTAPWRAP